MPSSDTSLFLSQKSKHFTLSILFRSFVALAIISFCPLPTLSLPLHKDTSWPVDMVSDLSAYSKYIKPRNPDLARNLRQSANRLKAARLLYPEYPRIKGTEVEERYRNALPTMEDLKALKRAADKYPSRSPDKALYAAIYCMRQIGRDSERAWQLAPTGPLTEAKHIIDEATATVDRNVGKRDPARIPVMLASAYYYLHSGREKLAYGTAKEAIAMANNKFGAGSRQLVSTIKYASLIFHSTKRKPEFKRLLKYNRKISTDPFTRANTKADFYF